MLKSTIVVVEKRGASYPKMHDFRPSIKYPEYIFKNDISDSKNDAYELVRTAFYKAGYDTKNYGTEKWNPLGEFIDIGDNVVLKPNLVMHINKSGDSEDCLYTHPSVVAAVIDYVIIALHGKGKIIVGDAPIQNCDFDYLVRESGYDELVKYYKNQGVDICLVDFRELSSYVKRGIRYNVINGQASGKIIDLGDESEFTGSKKKYLNNLRITNYDPHILKSHHQVGKHEYYISDYILNADVIINMPKPKTHRKAGVTISLKNMIGINVRKEFLPHHSIGSSKDGGDEYKNRNFFKRIDSRLLDLINTSNARKQYFKMRLYKFLKKINQQIIKFDMDKYNEGSWYGNNTISKTIVDVNKIVLYADKNGKMQSCQQRKVLIVADMLISGEREGPVLPSRKEVGAIAVGEDAVSFDNVIATLMGMDVKKIPTLYQANMSQYQIGNSSECLIRSNNINWDNKSINKIRYDDTWKFIPSSGWIGHIEIKH